MSGLDSELLDRFEDALKREITATVRLEQMRVDRESMRLRLVAASDDRRLYEKASRRLYDVLDVLHANAEKLEGEGKFVTNEAMLFAIQTAKEALASVRFDVPQVDVGEHPAPVASAE